MIKSFFGLLTFITGVMLLPMMAVADGVDETLVRGEIAGLLVGNVIVGEDYSAKEPKPFEYKYLTSGTIRDLRNKGRTGVWMISDDQLCQRWPSEEMTCATIEREGHEFSAFIDGAQVSRFTIRK